jgi:hypothetical protein
MTLHPLWWISGSAPGLQAMEPMKQRLEDLERVVEDDYKFLNRNVRKLFGMVGNMRGKWCNTCLKYH